MPGNNYILFLYHDIHILSFDSPVSISLLSHVLCAVFPDEVYLAAELSLTRRAVAMLLDCFSDRLRFEQCKHGSVNISLYQRYLIIFDF